MGSTVTSDSYMMAVFPIQAPKFLAAIEFSPIGRANRNAVVITEDAIASKSLRFLAAHRNRAECAMAAKSSVTFDSSGVPRQAV
jgi:hypothetical protein